MDFATPIFFDKRVHHRFGKKYQSWGIVGKITTSQLPNLSGFFHAGHEILTKSNNFFHFFFNNSGNKN